IWRQAVAILREKPPSDDPDPDRQARDAEARRQSIEQALRQKVIERDRILGLYRRGLIDDEALERQLEEIDREEQALREELARLDGDARPDTRAILEQARALLDGPLTDEIRRRILTLLIDEIVVYTEGEGRQKKARIEVQWRV